MRAQIAEVIVTRYFKLIVMLSEKSSRLAVVGESEAFLFSNFGPHIYKVLSADIHGLYCFVPVAFSLCGEQEIVGEDSGMNPYSPHISHPSNHEQRHHGHGKRAPLGYRAPVFVGFADGFADLKLYVQVIELCCCRCALILIPTAWAYPGHC